MMTLKDFIDDLPLQFDGDEFLLACDMCDIIVSSMQDDTPEAFVQTALALRGGVILNQGQSPRPVLADTLALIIDRVLEYANRDDLKKAVLASMELAR